MPRKGRCARRTKIEPSNTHCSLLYQMAFVCMDTIVALFDTLYYNCVNSTIRSFVHLTGLSRSDQQKKDYRQRYFKIDAPRPLEFLDASMPLRKFALVFTEVKRMRGDDPGYP